MGNSTEVVKDWSVVVITNNVQNSRICVGILSALWFWQMATINLVDDHVVQALLSLENLQETPKVWVEGSDGGKHFAVPALYMIVRSGQLVFRPRMHIPQIMAEFWGHSLVSSNASDIVVLEIICDWCDIIRQIIL